MDTEVQIHFCRGRIYTPIKEVLREDILYMIVKSLISRIDNGINIAGCLVLDQRKRKFGLSIYRHYYYNSIIRYLG
jgi:hypothetical protein